MRMYRRHPRRDPRGACGRSAAGSTTTTGRRATRSTASRGTSTRRWPAGGWIGIAIPERYGGGGQGIREAATVLEEVAASGACMNGASALHLSVFGMHPVVGPRRAEEMKQQYLRRDGRRRGGCTDARLGVTEPDAARRPHAHDRAASVDGDQYVVINGRKVWTTKALEADRGSCCSPPRRPSTTGCC